MEIIKIFKTLQMIQYGIAFVILIISWKKALSLKTDIINEKQYDTAFNLYMISIGFAFLADWEHTALRKVPYFQQKDFMVILFMTLITLIVSGISVMRAKRLNKNEISTLMLNKYLKPVAIFIVINYEPIINHCVENIWLSMYFLYKRFLQLKFLKEKERKEIVSIALI